MSVDANIYDLQNLKCQRLRPNCEILRSPRFANRAAALPQTFLENSLDSQKNFTRSEKNN